MEILIAIGVEILSEIFTEAAADVVEAVIVTS